MFLQEIVISPDIFETISNFFSTNPKQRLDFDTFMENLKLKKMVIETECVEDSEISKETERLKERASDLGKHYMDSILRKFNRTDKFVQKSIVDCNVFSDDRLRSLVVNLGLLSESKIVISTRREYRKLRDEFQELSELEILDLRQFNKPPSESKNFVWERRIKRNKGQYFNFMVILKPYLIDSENIEVRDRYLRGELGSKTLLKLLSLCCNLKSAKIITIAKDKTDDNFKYTFAEFKDLLSSNCPRVEFTFSNTKDYIPKDRYISNERFTLYFSTPGIDMVNDDYIVGKNGLRIEIEKKSGKS